MTKDSTSKRGCAHFAALFLTILAAQASAVPLRFEITGVVERADGTGLLEIGEAVDLVLDIDLELPVVLPSAFFSVSSASGSGTAGGDALTLSSGELTSWQISDGFTFDLQGVGPTLGSSVFEGIELAPGVFDGAGLEDFLALDASDVRELRLRVRTTTGSSSTPTRADVAVTSFSVVPEPGTAALLSLGLLGLGMRGRPKRTLGPDGSGRPRRIVC